jgi:hypothetical protein
LSAAPRPALARFLASAFAGCQISPIVPDASSRRFFRVEQADRGSVVVMDYGSPFDAEPDDVILSRVFTAAGLPVAKIHAVVPDPGCLVLEDLGPETLEDHLARLAASPATTGVEARRRSWPVYERAAALAAAVATQGTPVLRASPRAHGPALDAERFRFEMDFFLRHYVIGWLQAAFPADELIASLNALADAAASSSAPVLCHRDFHSRNLIVRQDGSLAMVDIQDARWGPDTYDIASLLCDAYVDLDEGLVGRLLAVFRDLQPDVAAEDALRARFDVVAAQRMIKALGTFGYQTGVLGRRRYLAPVPRLLARLQVLLPRLPDVPGLWEVWERSGLAEPPVGSF